MLRQRHQAGPVLGAVRGMQHLDPVEPERRQRLDVRAGAITTGMRQDRDPAALVHEGNGVAHPQPPLLHERGTPGAEVAIEGVAMVARPAVLHEGTRDVRASEGRVGRAAEHVVEGDADADVVQPSHHRLGARAARDAKDRQLALHLVEPVEVEPQQVHSRSRP